MDDTTVCPACGAGMLDHPQCVLCKCFTHANVQVRHDRAICRDCDKALLVRGARRCKACGDIRALEKFSRCSTSYERVCMRCASRRKQRKPQTDQNKRWRAANREKYNAGRRRRYAERGEEARAYNRAQYQKHRDKRRAYGRVYQHTYKHLRLIRNRASCRRWRERRKLRILQQIREDVHV